MSSSEGLDRYALRLNRDSAAQVPREKSIDMKHEASIIMPVFNLPICLLDGTSGATIQVQHGMIDRKNYRILRSRETYA